MNMATTTRSRSLANINRTVAGGLGILGGVWLIVSPFLLYYTNGPLKVSGENATTFGVIAGIAAIVLSVVCIALDRMDASLKARMIAGASLVGIGILTMAAPYLFNYNKVREPQWNLQITGAIFILVAGFIIQEIYHRYKGETL